ncbi:MAG: hypothetical protein EBU66_14840 [Bacteroidetes bacterium]|jgi:hypothetical protein|nr:hypothetical protein [bacterium]NBP65924.1 hypothetical protein [Bacteroidota bacterium]
MPKSKTRGSLKEHRKRVQTRNNTLRGLRKKAQEEYQKMFNETMEKLQAQYQTENGEILDINAEVVGEVNDVNVTEAEVVTPEVSDEN